MKQIKAWNWVIAVIFLFTGCSENVTTQLTTQGRAEIPLQADQYSILVNFAAQGQTSEQALSKLTQAQQGFLKWKDDSKQKVVTQYQSVNPQYHYPKQGKRTLSGYQAVHRFQVQALDLQQYTKAMTKISEFNPQSLNQGEVGVSADKQQGALKRAYDQAFKANEQKVNLMLKAADLCHPQVVSMQEQSSAPTFPRTMMMEAKSAPVANEKTISVTLDITWQASNC
ncbi:oxidative stress defense protein [Oceaniserpentilla sp. 4NH20-0058]|uniref:SIMPL domain-containing protein n=1 Tax=Oceaniserpentilla sp. 4NH20-0058 TaxID=3127660 RepID=UPI0031080158